MRLQDLAIRAMNGAALVEGELRLVGDSDVVLPHSGPGELIGVELARKAFGKTSFSLFRRIDRGADGLFGATAPLLTVEFAESVPGLYELLARADRGGHYRLSAQGLRVVDVRFRDPEAPADGLRDLYAEGSDLDLRLAVDERGIHISFEAPVLPSTRVRQAPLFRHAKVIANLTVPAAYCRLQGSLLPISFPFGGHKHVVGDWQPTGQELAGVPMNSIGAPYCSGTLDFGDRSSFALTGPFVELYLRDHDLGARPVDDLKLLHSGFAQAGRYASDGPELRLNMGFHDWARMLEQTDAAEIELTGAGIGQVDGQTGRSVGECGGPMTQPITALRLILARLPEGLSVTGRGELAPLEPASDRSLGPDLAFDFVIPRTWILARGIPLRGFWEDRKRDFPSDDTW